MKKPVKAAAAVPFARLSKAAQARYLLAAAARKPVPKKPAKKVVPPKLSPAAAAKAKKKRHLAAVKAAHTRAANLKKAKAHKRVQLTLGEGVACCAAEALAASLRTAGWPVSDADVLALYWRTARDEDTGASILATMEAAAEYGLAGIRPVAWAPVKAADFMPAFMPGLILGLALPAAHAVLDTGSEWITWGERWPAWAFPDAAILEAWEVTWPDSRSASRCASRRPSGSSTPTAPPPWSTPPP